MASRGPANQGKEVGTQSIANGPAPSTAKGDIRQDASRGTGGHLAAALLVVAAEVRALCDEFDPECVLVDQVSLGSTLGMYATGRPFSTLVPGHPSQLPVGRERYGIPPIWPAAMLPDEAVLAELEIVGSQPNRSRIGRGSK